MISIKIKSPLIHESILQGKGGHTRTRYLTWLPQRKKKKTMILSASIPVFMGELDQLAI
jgi:hypothetical protein